MHEAHTDRLPGPGPGSGPGSEGEPFTFGIPLIAREAAGDWQRVDALLELVLRSVRAQSDGNFRLLLAGHEEPPCWGAFARSDERFRFLQADWPAATPTPRNDDGGCKKWLIKEAVRRCGGGLLMYLDADDLIDSRLVEMARQRIGADHVGAILDYGIALDFRTLRAVRLPDARVFDGAFHEVCGSSTIGRLEPANADASRRDAHDWLGSHHQWPERAAATGVRLAHLPVWGAYLVNTSENHSELHGPYAGWRQTFNRAVADEGAPLDERLAARFGLDLRTLASRFGAPAAGGRYRPGQPDSGS